MAFDHLRCAQKPDGEICEVLFEFGSIRLSVPRLHSLLEAVLGTDAANVKVASMSVLLGLKLSCFNCFRQHV